jgi:hypothetical protein
VDANATAAFSLTASRGLRWVDDGDVLGTTALGVLDSAACGAARGGLLAGGSTGHAVVKFEIAVELYRDLNFGNRERRDR